MPTATSDTAAGTACADLKVWNIASYPRSGNHLVRALIEYASERPTRGCPGASRDTAIHRRDANARSNLISIRHEQPVAAKSHFAKQIKQNEEHLGADRLILVTRDPSEAIASHLARTFERKLLVTRRRLRRAVEAEVDAYVALLFAFNAKPDSMRLHVRYEALIDDTAGLDEARRIVDAVSGNRQAMTDAAWHSIRETAKESQSALGTRSPALRDRVRAVVASYITYDEVEAFLASGQWQRPGSASRGAAHSS